jgi:glyoxylase-like metal-dependent hydrolase (beta-lactamase superfamily II)
MKRPALASLLGLALLGTALGHAGGCVGAAPDGPGGTPDGPGGTPDGRPDGGPQPDGNPGGGLVPGSLQVAWMHGSANCNQNADPELQVHAYNSTTYILRQNKCRTFEAPFVYVLLGQTGALVLDSGATNTTTLRERVKTLVGARAVTVAHSHAHGDHVAGDATFSGQAGFTVVGRSQAAVQAAFNITTWPTTPGTLDLGGGRVLDVLGVPGHEATHIVVYDRQTGLLLTGDTLYPGFLFINDWATYRTSIRRLAQFVAAHQISHVLGAHIEMSSTPKVGYPYGTTYQPAEHVLQLTAAHVTQLDAALTALGATPPAQRVAYDDFIVDPQ